MAGSHSHRATLKKKNKGFKGGHSSKRAIKAANKGKVEKLKANNKALKTPSKLQRKNLAKQLKANKIMQTIEGRKLFSSGSFAERIITVIPLTSNISSIDIINKLLLTSGEQTNGDEIIDAEDLIQQENLLIEKEPSVTSIRIKRYKTNLKIIIPDKANFISILDSAKVADFVILGMSATEEIDPKVGEQIIRTIESQGISTVIGVIPDLVSAYPKRNFQLDILKSLTSFFQHFFPDTDKLYALENPSDSSNCMRTICQKFPKSITWRDTRGYLVADHLEWQASETSNNGTEGSLVVEGVVRGAGFQANRLIHIPGFGDFTINKIEKFIHQKNVDEQGTFFPDQNQDTLEELLPLEEDMEDDMDNNSYNDEFDMDRMTNEMEVSYNQMNNGASQKKRLPKGMSAYQARWYLEDELEELIEEDGLESEEESDEDEDEDGMVSGDEVMDENMLAEQNDGKYAQSEMFVELSPEEEARQLQQYKDNADEDLQFPDEVEMNPEVSAQKRLARYRGVKSLGNCDWDYDEYDKKRPSEWERYLRVTNFKATRQKILKQYAQNSQVKAGDKVRIYINAPYYITEKLTDPKVSPFIMYGLLEHEHKQAVCNFSVQSWEGYENPIPSKEMMIVQYGFRRQVIRPMFSNNNHNPNNVSKYQRFLHPGSRSIATAIVPITFTNAPALFFKHNSSTNQVEFLAQGTFLNCDHTRILAKRIVLTGAIYKIHKSVVTVRYMFFNSEDVLAYKHIPLFTKMGRSGLIKESLGTHGYFKATFDGKLNAQDIIAMSLYKRVWPKPSTLYVE